MSQTVQELHLVSMRTYSRYYKPQSRILYEMNTFFLCVFVCVVSRVFWEVCAVGSLLWSTDT